MFITAASAASRWFDYIFITAAIAAATSALHRRDYITAAPQWLNFITTVSAVS